VILNINKGVIDLYNKAFLVSDSCKATERNGNSMSIGVTEDTIEND
jgi:hypothetical protein